MKHFKIHNVFLLSSSLLMLLFLQPQQATAQAFCHPFYSSVDSILYLQFPNIDNPDPYVDFRTYRVRDGGSRVESIADDCPGGIVTSDHIPGHIFSLRWLGPSQVEMYSSQDYGDTWASIDMPHRTHGVYGRPGEDAGESFLFMDYNLLYFTSDSWQSYDSIFSNLLPDSIEFINLSYQNGLIYGTIRHEWTICVSSDSGQTWAIGHPDTMRWGGLTAGASDELWACALSAPYVYLLRDTGRTVVTFDSLVVPDPPPIELGVRIVPTDHPGEAYFLYIYDWWSFAEVLLYHIEDYGAQINSFHYDFPYYDAATPPRPPLPTTISLSAYPNPFNASVRFMFETPSQGLRHLSIHDVLGRQVWEWHGYANEIIWQGTNSSGISLPSGKYWATINCNNQKQTTSVILLR